MEGIPVDPEGRMSIPEATYERLSAVPGDEPGNEASDDWLTNRAVSKLPISAFRGLFKVEPALDLDWAEMREIAWREQTKRLIRDGAGYDDSVEQIPSERIAREKIDE